MTLKKRYLLLSGLISLSVTASFSAEPQSIVLAKHDGTEIAILLSDSPKITFSIDEENYSGSQMMLTTSKAQYEFEVADLNGLKISESVPTAIEAVTTPEEQITFASNGDAVVITTEKPVRFTVYSILGTTVHNAMIPAGVTSYPLDRLSSGIYIFKADTKSIKLLIR